MLEKKAIAEHASCGALHSHRRAWHIAQLIDPTAWCMFIEDDISLRANAADQLHFAFDQVAKRRIPCAMLCFVPGGSADHQNYIKDNCWQLARHTQHTEIRHYPFVQGPKGLLRAKHVGCGLKFYALAPQARTVLRRLTFQMCAWEMEIFRAVANEVKVENPRHWTAVGVLLPGLGEHSRDFKDFHLGSGRFRTDRGHEAGPYVFVNILDETDLGQRLHMLAIGLDLARIGKIGCVWTWPASKTVPFDFHDIFRICDDAKTSGIAFTLVIADKADSGTKKYYRDRRSENIVTIDENLCYMEYMAILQSETFPGDEFVEWIAMVCDEPTLQWIELQPWCEAAMDEWYGETASWPTDWSECFLVWLPSSTLMHQIDKDPALNAVEDNRTAEQYEMDLMRKVTELLGDHTARILLANATEAHMSAATGAHWGRMVQQHSDQIRLINSSLRTPVMQYPWRAAARDNSSTTPSETHVTSMRAREICALFGTPLAQTFGIKWDPMIAARHCGDMSKEARVNFMWPMTEIANTYWLRSAAPSWLMPRQGWVSGQPHSFHEALQHQWSVSEQWKFWKRKLKAVGMKLTNILAQHDMWAPHISKAQKSVLDRLPGRDVALLDNICTSECHGARDGKVSLSKIGQCFFQCEALRHNREQYNKVTDKTGDTWNWLTAAILVKVNEHHTQNGQPYYFQISDNKVSWAPWNTDHAHVLHSRAWEMEDRCEQLQRKCRSPSPPPGAASSGWQSKRGHQ